MKRRAFTLIELLIVVAIIGILAAIAVPNFMNARMRATITKSISDLKSYQTIQHMYLLDQGDIPGYYHGRDEHCPYINLGYISERLADPFTDEEDEMFPHLQGMLHAGTLGPWWNDEQFQDANPLFFRQWTQAGKPYFLYGQGPAPVPQLTDMSTWACFYDSSNGLHSNGGFLIMGVKGKGNLGPALFAPRCN